MACAKGGAMIARTWTARASLAGAEAYAEFFNVTLTPELATIEGHRGSMVLRHPMGDDDVLITVVTFWESMAAIGRFAGATPELAVVEPEARSVLVSFDERVRHHEVVVARFGREL
jgi:heme-degrading monooxygenase HmoA